MNIRYRYLILAVVLAFLIFRAIGARASVEPYQSPVEKMPTLTAEYQCIRFAWCVGPGLLFPEREGFELPYLGSENIKRLLELRRQLDKDDNGPHQK